MDGPSETLAGLTLTQFSELLASAAPVPGGGSASAICGSFAGSLLAMVARLSLERPKYEPYRATNERAREAGDRGRRVLLELADTDARAYAGFAAAREASSRACCSSAVSRAILRAAAKAA